MNLPELVFAISRSDVAGYVSALFTVYIVLIFIRILMSWIPRLPENGAIRAVAEFTREVTDPYLNIFRRFIPPIGAGGMGLDLSPVLGVLLLVILQGIVVRAIAG